MAPLLFYAADTPNNLKVAIALEEMGLPYHVMPIDLDARQQFAPEFLALNPNNKLPVVVDADGPGGVPISIFESGAILQYLGRKTATLYPADERRRAHVEQWLFWQMAGLGPMLGQAWHFGVRRKTEPYAAARFSKVSGRLGRVLEGRLREAAYLGGDDYSIADIAVYPWARSSCRMLGITRRTHPNCRRWLRGTDELLTLPRLSSDSRRSNKGASKRLDGIHALPGMANVRRCEQARATTVDRFSPCAPFIPTNRV